MNDPAQNPACYLSLSFFFFSWLWVEWCLSLLMPAHRTSGHILLIENLMKKENISPACCRVACKFPQITYLSLHWLGARYWKCNLREQSVQKRNLTGREKVSQQEHTSASRAKRKHWTVVRSAKIPHPIVLNMDAHNSHVSEKTWLDLISLLPIDVLAWEGSVFLTGCRGDFPGCLR